jgi:hypothetical protein
MTEVEPVFYDCEASDVEGYPIEIGWAFTDPKTGAVVSESHLIRPPAEWPVKESWDRVAERLHGITLLQLSRKGRPSLGSRPVHERRADRAGAVLRHPAG